MGLAEESVVMVGDDIENDVGGAQKNGIKGVLVKTGKYNRDFVERADIRPYRIIKSFKELPEN